jgi:hypothetical protein
MCHYIDTKEVELQGVATSALAAERLAEVMAGFGG